MTESEVLKIFENEVIILECWIEHCKDIIADCETEDDEFDDDKERAELSYKEIGTVEECREAVEKQKLKRPIKDKWKHDCCPSCGWFVSEETGWGDRYNPHCENCGQAIRWENLGEMEDERD